MHFLFCQPSLKNKNTVDYLIRSIIIKTLNLKKNYLIFDSFKRNRNNKLINYLENNTPKVFFLFFNGLLTYLSLKKLLNKKSISKIFLDSYTIFDLFFFSILNLKKNKIKIFIYLRIPYDQIIYTKLFFYYSIFYLKKNDNIVFLTDTNELKKHFKKKFNIECKIIPIPSKINNSKKLKKINLKKINILFPGKSRSEKGISQILNIFDKMPENIEVFFKFIKNKNILEALKTKKVRTFPLKEKLTYKEYIQSIINSEILILPYTHKTYKMRSSGVFIDAIKLNKFCFVSDNTWMASLLKKNKLNIFILKSWSIGEIYKRVKYINQNFIKFNKIYTNFRHNILLFNSEKKFRSTILKLMIDKK